MQAILRRTALTPRPGGPEARAPRRQYVNFLTDVSPSAPPVAPCEEGLDDPTGIEGVAEGGAEGGAEQGAERGAEAALLSELNRSLTALGALGDDAPGPERP